MAFHDVRLPEDIERGAIGGLGFKTTILSLASGHEQRNIDWSIARGSWDVGYGMEHKEDFDDVNAFHKARYGRAHSFRFKDWSDFELARQAIGATDTSTATFQIYKRYSSGDNYYDRILNKIVENTAQAWVNNTERTVVYDTSPAATEVSIATATGIVTLGSTLVALSAAAIEILCEFDVLVRFDSDKLDISMQHYDAGEIPNVEIVEVLAGSE